MRSAKPSLLAVLILGSISVCITLAPSIMTDPIDARQPSSSETFPRGQDNAIGASDGGTPLHATYMAIIQGSGNGIWVDGAGAAYVCGQRGDGLLLAKYDAGGTLIWNSTWYSEDEAIGNSVWGDGKGNVYVCGDAYNSSAYRYRLVLTKWNENGDLLWNRTWNNATIFNSYGRGVAGDSTGIYTCGGLSLRGILLKWDAAGNINWSRSWGEGSIPDVTSGNGIWCSSQGSIYVVGTRGELTDLILLKWNHVGNLMWSTTWGGSYADYGDRIYGDGTYIYTSGTHYTNDTASEAVVVKWNIMGGQELNWTIEGTSHGKSIWGDHTGNIYTWPMLTKWTSNGTIVANRTVNKTDIGVDSAIWCNASCVITLGKNHSSSTWFLLRWGANPPFLTSPGNTTFIQSFTPRNLTWIPNGASSPWTKYYRIGGVSGVWTSGSPIVLMGLEHLLPYTFNFTLVIFDVLGDQARDTVFVTVMNAPPVITAPDPVSYMLENDAISVRWTVSDPDVKDGNRTLIHDGAVHSCIAWPAPNSPVTWGFNLFELGPGTHNFTVILNDGYGGTAQSTLYVTIVNGPPVIETFYDQMAVDQNQARWMFWIINDVSTTAARNYTLYRDGSPLANGTWTDGVRGGYILQNQELGTFNYTVVAYDGYGGTVQGTVIVTVRPVPPTTSVPGAVPFLVLIAAAAGVAVVIARGRRAKDQHS